MSEVKWIKITTSMFDDDKIKLIESMPDKDAVLIIWIKLLIQAGKTNAKGYIFLNENIPYTDEMLSTIFNRPLNTVRLALNTFKKFGMIEIDENGVYISNWDKHQSIDKLEKMKEQNRLRQLKYRENKKELEDKKSNVTVTSRNALDVDVDLELDLEKEYIHVASEKKITLGQAYEKYFNQTVNAHHIQILTSYMDKITEEVIIEAIKRAEGKERPFDYCKTILNNWINQQVKTLDDVKKLDEEFEGKKGKKIGDKPLEELYQEGWK